MNSCVPLDYGGFPQSSLTLLISGGRLKNFPVVSRFSRDEQTICHRASCVGLRHQGKGLDEAARRFVSKIYQPSQRPTINQSRTVLPGGCDVSGDVLRRFHRQIDVSHPRGVLGQGSEARAEHRPRNGRD